MAQQPQPETRCSHHLAWSEFQHRVLYRKPQHMYLHLTYIDPSLKMDIPLCSLSLRIVKLVLNLNYLQAGDLISYELFLFSLNQKKKRNKFFIWISCFATCLPLKHFTQGHEKAIYFIFKLLMHVIQLVSFSVIRQCQASNEKNKKKKIFFSYFKTCTFSAICVFI